MATDVRSGAGASAWIPYSFLGQLVLLWTYGGSTGAPQANRNTGVGEYCQWESMNATCDRNHVILMEAARYGRMRVGRCVSQEYGYVGCHNDVLDYADSVCSGRRECRLPVTGFVSMLGQRPCPKDVASYLEAKYICQPVAYGDYRQCMSSKTIPLEGPSGFIASSMTRERQVGSPNCPWSISVRPGQRINITLLDMGVWTQRRQVKHNQRVFCSKYATITENKQQTPICAGDERQRNVFISKGRHVQIAVHPSQPERQFLFKFEAVGCMAPKPPRHGRVDVDGDMATFRCNLTRHSWTLKCQGATWVGRPGNCSTATDPDFLASVFGKDWSSSQGIFIVVGLGIALGVVIGLVMLTVALFCLRRRGWRFSWNSKPRGEARPMNTPDHECKYGTGTGKVYHQEPLLHEGSIIDSGLGTTYGEVRMTWPPPPPPSMRPVGTGTGGLDKPFAPKGPKNSLQSLGHIYESPDFIKGDNISSRDAL